MTIIEWFRGDNNPTLPKDQYMYGTRHICILLAVLAVTIILSLIFARRSEKTKKILFTVCAFIFLFFEILQRVVNLIFTDDYSFYNIMKILLPAYLCSIMVCLIIVAIFSNKKALINFSAIGGLLATLAFLLFPAVGISKTYISFSAFYSIFSHSLGFVVSILLIVTRYAKFEFKKIWQSFVICASVVTYGIIMTLYIFPNTEDYVFAIKNPLELTSAIPYPIIYGLFWIGFISIFYVIEFVSKKIFKNLIINKI